MSNKGRRRIYSEIVAIDWYDGATTGIFKLDQSEQWFLFNLCFFDPANGQRIFFIIQQSSEWIQQFVEMMAEDAHGTLVHYEVVKLKMSIAFEQYSGDVYLLNTSGLEEVEYTVAEAPLFYLTFTHTIEDSMKQEEDYIIQLKSFFLS